MAKQKHVRFIKHSIPYNAGEVAHFDEEKADQIVKSGAAVHHDPETGEDIKVEPVAEADKTAKPKKGKKAKPGDSTQSDDAAEDEAGSQEPGAGS